MSDPRKSTSVLKRSIHGTWHHVSPKHLGKYVNEATFRLNDGNCEVDTINRMESLARGSDAEDRQRAHGAIPWADAGGLRYSRKDASP